MADRTIPRRRKAQHSVPTTDAAQGHGTVTPLAPRRILELIRQGPNADVVELLRGLLRQAEAGELAGIVVVGLFPAGNDRKYDLSLAGLAAANPTLAVGAMDVCHMLLREAALDDSGLV